MGGICGLIDFNSEIGLEERRGIIQKMSNALAHRGSGDGFHYSNHRIALSSRRSITNTEEKKNISSYEVGDRKIICLLDGSIYNSQDIGRKILGNVHKKLTTDFIIANLYRKYKGEFLNYTDGEFSLAIWDEAEETLVLARDQFGSRPLFYYYDNHILVFASEIKSILASKIVPIEVNVPAINDFMSFGYVPHPETMFKDIFQIEPGASLVITPNHIAKRSYWEFEFKENEEYEEKHYTSAFMHLLERAVKKRTDDDLPTGAYLSGGIDSSGICGIMSKFINRPFKAFSIGFNEDQFNELPYARIVAQHLNLDWIYHVIGPKDVIPLFEKMVFLYDAPFEDTSAFPSYFGAKIASDRVKVILTGDGPDQLMGGSNHYVHMQNSILSDKWYLKILRGSGLKHVFRSLPLRAHNESLLNRAKRRIYRESLSFDERICEPRVAWLLFKRHLYAEDLLRIDQLYNPARNILIKLKKVRNRHPIEQYLYFDIYFFMHDDLIPKVERTCTANAIVCRSPYRDKELIGLIETLPLKYRIKGLETKYLLKKAFTGLIPDQIIYKKKQGFDMPRDAWFIGDNDLRDYIKQILLDRKCLERGYFKQQVLRELVRDYFSGRVSYYTSSSRLIVSLVTLELWHRIFIQ